MSHPSPPPVRVLAAGLALTVGLAGCSDGAKTQPPPPPEAPPPPEVAEPADLPTANPPPPEVVEPADLPTANPPPPEVVEPAAALPTWEQVESGHPVGATNPPMPVLVAREDGSACFKAWYDPRAVPAEARQKGGIVLDAAEEPPAGATAITCPAEPLAELLQHHAQAAATEGG